MRQASPDPLRVIVTEPVTLWTILEDVLLNSMCELPSLDNVSKVVVDENVIEGEAEPYILYENQQQAVGASE